MKTVTRLISILSSVLIAMAASADSTSLAAKSPASPTATELSTNAVVSSDGRFIVFLSSSPNIVEGDNNLETDAFLFDRTAGTTQRLENLRVCANSEWFSIDDISISATGRYVAVGVSERCNPNDEEYLASLLLIDRQTGTRRTVGSGYSKQYVHARFSADNTLLVFQLNDWYGYGSSIWLFNTVNSQTTLISKGSDPYPTGDSFDPEISADGTVIAFTSADSLLVPNDTNDTQDVFVYRRATGQIERISRSPAGLEGNGPSGEPSINANGMFIAFSTLASNIAATVTTDSNGASDIYVRDVAAATTVRVSKKAGGIQLNGGSFHPAISADGRYVVFSSDATNAVVDDTNGVEDLFIRDRTASVTTRLTLTAAAEQGNGDSVEPSISSDARYVAFRSAASNFILGDKNRATDVILLDRQTVTFTAATKSVVPSAGIGIDSAVISGTGGQIAFTSDSASFVANDLNGTQDVFVRDIAASTVSRVSKASDGTESNGYSYGASISDSGKAILFYSYATNLVPNDTTQQSDLFVRDVDAATTKQVNVSTSGEQANDTAHGGAISRNGKATIFFSQATNLASTEPNPYGQDDLFFRDLVAGTTERINQTAGGQKIYMLNGAALVSTDGRYVAFGTDQSLVSQDTYPYDYDLYLKDRQTGTFERLTPRTTSTEEWCCYQMRLGGISLDSRYIVFTSESPSLVANDSNGFEDVFVRDRQAGTTTLVNVIPSNVASLDRMFISSSISDDGRIVCATVRPFEQQPFNVPHLMEVYCRDRQSGAATRASVSSSGVAANADAYSSSMSGDGKRMVFISQATNLVSDPIQTSTAFLHESGAAASPSIKVTPATISFGSIVVGKTSGVKTVVVVNSGTAPVTLTVTMAGTHPSQFKKTNNCPSQISAGAQCTVSVSFKPISKGAKSAILKVTPTGGAAKNVTLSGTGT